MGLSVLYSDELVILRTSASRALRPAWQLFALPLAGRMCNVGCPGKLQYVLRNHL